MTLPDYFINDSRNVSTVTYYFRCSEEQYACVEYYLPGPGSLMPRGSWAGSFYEDVEAVENYWDEWTTEDYSVAIEEEPDGDVAKTLLLTLVFK